MPEPISAEILATPLSEQVKPVPTTERNIKTSITEGARNLVTRISSRLNRNVNPDEVLKDIASASITEQAIPESRIDEPEANELGTFKPSIAKNEEEANKIKVPDFDQESYRKLERSMMVLPQFIRTMGVNNPRVQSMVQELFNSEAVLQAALSVEGHNPAIAVRLNTLLENGSDIRGMRDFIRSITIRNSTQLEVGLQPESSLEVKAATLGLYTSLLYGDLEDPTSAQSIKIGLSAMEQHPDTIQQGLNGELGKFDSTIMLRRILGYGTPQLTDQVTSTMQQVIQARNGEASSTQNNQGLKEADQDLVLFGKLLKNANSQLIERVKPLIGAKISQLGINTTDMVNAWSESAPISRLGETVKQNVEAIQVLEESRKGITKTLNQEYGINDFGRYPAELLIQQYDDFIHHQENPLNAEKPYGIILNPRHDNTGAFYQDVELFDNLFKQLKDLNFGVKVTEVDSKRGAVRSLNRLRHQSGQISFAVVGGHGTPNAIQIGQDPSEGEITVDDLQRKGAQALSLAFTDNPIILFNSCSTGVEEGVGQVSSNLHSGENIAPDKDTSIESIKVSSSDDGKLHFGVEYNDKASPKIYARGVQQ